jgi:predicted RNA-binding protein YlqC (UPF0109 family)
MMASVASDACPFHGGAFNAMPTDYFHHHGKGFDAMAWMDKGKGRMGKGKGHGAHKGRGRGYGYGSQISDHTIHGGPFPHSLFNHSSHDHRNKGELRPGRDYCDHYPRWSEVNGVTMADKGKGARRNKGKGRGRSSTNERSSSSDNRGFVVQGVHEHALHMGNEIPVEQLYEGHNQRVLMSNSHGKGKGKDRSTWNPPREFPQPPVSNAIFECRFCDWKCCGRDYKSAEVAELARNQHQADSHEKPLDCNQRRRSSEVRSAGASANVGEAIKFTILPKDVGKVIGKRGSNIRGMRLSSGANINVDSATKEVTITGTPEQKQVAFILLTQALNTEYF